MSFRFNPEIKTTIEEINVPLEAEALKYFTAISKAKEMEWIFLKAFMFAEDILGSALDIVFHTPKTFGITRKIAEARKIIEAEELENALSKLESVKAFRHKLAHDLEYQLEEDVEFWVILEVDKDADLEIKRSAVIYYFNNINRPFLYFYLGVKLFDSFVISVKN